MKNNKYRKIRRALIIGWALIGIVIGVTGYALGFDRSPEQLSFLKDILTAYACSTIIPVLIAYFLRKKEKES